MSASCKGRVVNCSGIGLDGDGRETECEHEYKPDPLGSMAGNYPREPLNAEEFGKDYRICKASLDIMSEVRRAFDLHGPIVSTHEGLGVLLEEFEEFKDEVKKREFDQHKARKELIQVAAVAIRIICDCCPKAGGIV